MARASRLWGKLESGCMVGDAYASCITEIGSEFGNGDSPTRMAKVLNKPAVIKVHGKGEQQLPGASDWAW